MLNKISIVILTRNRAKFIKRQIEYIINWEAQIFLLDGSDEKNLYLNDLSEKHSHIKYIHDTNGVFARFEYMKNQIKTKYAMLMADDEFFIKKSLEKCIDFLENNSDYVSCSGVAIGFMKSFDDKVIYREMYPRLIGYKISGNNPKDRVIDHMSRYVASSVYGVLHSSLINKFFNELKYTNTSCSETYENWIQNSTAYMGKIMVLPVLYWFRSMENSPVQDKNWKRAVKFYQWYNKKKFKDEKSKYIENFCKANNENSYNFFEIALSNLSKDLYQRGQGTLKLGIRLFFKRGINFVLRKLKLRKMLAKRNEAVFFDFEVLKDFLDKKKIVYDIESIKKIEKKILQK
jgi:glycosyltransferase domain-containing protein|tara:strand:- start:3785 stop:4822 length:1038 start_codon:yes stop_codon:yes gene_type:complete